MQSVLRKIIILLISGSIGLSGVVTNAQTNNRAEADLLYGIFYDKVANKEKVIPCYYVAEDDLHIDVVTGKVLCVEYQPVSSNTSIERYLTMSQQVDDSLFAQLMKNPQSMTQFEGKLVNKYSKLFPDLKKAKMDAIQERQGNKEHSFIWANFKKPIEATPGEKVFFGETTDLQIIIEMMTGHLYAYQGDIPNEINMVSAKEKHRQIKDIQAELETLINKEYPGKLKETTLQVLADEDMKIGIIDPIVTFTWQRYSNGYQVQGDGFKVRYDRCRNKMVDFEATWTNIKVPPMPKQTITAQKALAQAKDFMQQSKKH